MEAVLEKRVQNPDKTIGVELAWAWAVAFFLGGIAGFLPNPLLGPDSVFVTDAGHNVLHLTSAVAFAAMALLGNVASTRFMIAAGVLSLLLGALGFVTLAGEPTGYLFGVIHINGPDNVLHAALGAAILASGLIARRRVSPDEENGFVSNATRYRRPLALAAFSVLAIGWSLGSPLLFAAMQEAVVIKAGSFRDADSFHQGSGRATIYRLEDGSHELRLDEFRVTSGPDLRVLLAAHPNPASRDELRSSGYIELAKLKRNAGDQNYPIPESVDVSGQMSVVIYCRPFHVIFSVAPLEQVDS